jgi:hypothetical protein
LAELAHIWHTSLVQGPRTFVASPVPAFELKYLRKGHTVHFRCHHAEALGIDVMTKMRGVDSFQKLWIRRTTVSVNDPSLKLMSLIRKRPLLKLVTAGEHSTLAKALFEEEQREREADRRYWIP